VTSVVMACDCVFVCIIGIAAGYQDPVCDRQVRIYTIFFISI